MVDIEALRLALSKEQDAIEMYQKLLLEHPNLADLINFLITEEQKHKKLIERKITDLSR
ncbi:MAG TPA: hypothetical protein PL155_08545 [Candidatus Omnitrophota bacterium]|nr:hypothetical protein [Candidatus Omnitrophota bacterium]HPD85497.1 hypothetical protein [Candidatus Omnitrophota bacterium]HRZ04002.1 hypothetical protein [Candidatus Omnitrophota bacterium]